MSVTAAQIAQMRRMVAEPTAATYTDDLLEDIIELYPTIDELGTNALLLDTDGRSSYQNG